jgi:hypothetical protein
MTDMRTVNDQQDMAIQKIIDMLDRMQITSEEQTKGITKVASDRHNDKKDLEAMINRQATYLAYMDTEITQGKCKHTFVTIRGDKNTYERHSLCEGMKGITYAQNVYSIRKKCTKCGKKIDKKVGWLYHMLLKLTGIDLWGHYLAKD